MFEKLMVGLLLIEAALGLTITPPPGLSEFEFEKILKCFPACPLEFDIRCEDTEFFDTGYEYGRKAYMLSDGSTCESSCRDCIRKCPELTCPEITCDNPTIPRVIKNDRFCDDCPVCGEKDE